MTIIVTAELVSLLLCSQPSTPLSTTETANIRYSLPSKKCKTPHLELVSPASFSTPSCTSTGTSSILKLYQKPHHLLNIPWPWRCLSASVLGNTAIPQGLAPLLNFPVTTSADSWETVLCSLPALHSTLTAFVVHIYPDVDLARMWVLEGRGCLIIAHVSHKLPAWYLECRGTYQVNETKFMNKTHCVKQAASKQRIAVTQKTFLLTEVLQQLCPLLRMISCLLRNLWNSSREKPNCWYCVCQQSATKSASINR